MQCTCCCSTCWKTCTRCTRQSFMFARFRSARPDPSGNNGVIKTETGTGSMPPPQLLTPVAVCYVNLFTGWNKNSHISFRQVVSTDWKTNTSEKRLSQKYWISVERAIKRIFGKAKRANNSYRSWLSRKHFLPREKKEPRWRAFPGRNFAEKV